MPDLPSAEEQIRQLVRRGILPHAAERIVADCEARGHRLMTPEERNQAATVDAAAIEEARQWWYYAPDVPRKWKRLLDARDVTP
jgi:hypothetical protein